MTFPAGEMLQLSLFDPLPDWTRAKEPVRLDVIEPDNQACIRNPILPSQSPFNSPNPRNPPTSTSPAEPLLQGFAAYCARRPTPVDLEFSARMRSSWRVEWRRIPGSAPARLRLKLPLILKFASDTVQHAVLNWAELVSRRGRRPTDYAEEKVRLESLVQAYLQDGFLNSAGEGREAQAQATRLLKRNAKKLQRMEPKGRHHDLQAIFNRINEEYFSGGLEAQITWSRRIGGLSTHCIDRDGEGKPYHLITISRGYDFPDVPAEIVGGVVYHECLHIAVPPEVVNGRRVVHGREFRRRERQYRQFREWMAWHRLELPRKLGILSRECRRNLR